MQVTSAPVSREGRGEELTSFFIGLSEIRT